MPVLHVSIDEGFNVPYEVTQSCGNLYVCHECKTKKETKKLVDLLVSSAKFCGDISIVADYTEDFPEYGKPPAGSVVITR
jgi:hypothetical protein